MKISAITLLAAVAVAAAVGSGQAFATTGHHSALRVVMRDPGCHWFAVGNKLTTNATVSGRVPVLNLDMAALRVVSAGTVKRIPVGHSIVLGHGRYVITMVGQAPDDNRLTLSVH